jgi:hypothetical protein
MSSDGLLSLGKECPFPSPDIFSVTKTIEVDQGFEFHAPLASLVNDFE